MRETGKKRGEFDGEREREGKIERRLTRRGFYAKRGAKGMKKELATVRGR